MSSSLALWDSEKHGLPKTFNAAQKLQYKLEEVDEREDSPNMMQFNNTLREIALQKTKENSNYDIYCHYPVATQLQPALNYIEDTGDTEVLADILKLEWQNHIVVGDEFNYYLPNGILLTEEGKSTYNIADILASQPQLQGKLLPKNDKKFKAEFEKILLAYLQPYGFYAQYGVDEPNDGKLLRLVRQIGSEVVQIIMPGLRVRRGGGECSLQY